MSERGDTNSMHTLDRRRFITAAGAGALALNGLALQTGEGAEKKEKDPYFGLKVGVASYSFRNFDLDKTIEMMHELELKYITLKSMHLEYKTTTEERKAVAKQLKKAGLVLMGGGVIYMKDDEKQVRSMFEYARDAGMPVIVGAPDLAALPLVDKMAKEFDIRVAIHNHGPGDKKYPSPLDAYRLAQPFDKRIGVCIDIGHSVRNGDKELEVIEKVRDRLYDFHIKDVTKREKDGKGVPLGQGVIDWPGVLKALLKMKFEGHLALEYEQDAKNPLPGMKECFAYLRKTLAELHA